MPEGKSEKIEKILVLNVDRDNDIGKKTGIKGPIIGRDNIIETAVKLGVADPEESDCNALFETVRVFDDLKKQYSVEAAALTGDKDVGIKSDKEIAAQLDHVLKKFDANYAVLVSDGTGDEHVLPIIQSKVPILSVKRVIVKQSDRLESDYYKIKDFIKESLDNPRFSRLIFGLPGIFLLLYVFFGFTEWRIVLGLLGAYLLIKGFKIEDYILDGINEMKNSFFKSRFTFFTYIVTIVFIGLALFRGYTFGVDFWNKGVFEAIAAFLSASIYIFWIAGTVVWVGRSVGLKKRSKMRMLAAPLFGLAASLVIYNACDLILKPELSSFNFLLSIVVGFVLAFIALVLERKYVKHPSR
jgi:putative membrane protein